MEWPRQRTYVVKATLQFTGILLSVVQAERSLILAVLRNFVGVGLRDSVRIIRITALNSGARRESDGAQVEYTVDTTGEDQRDQAVDVMSDTSNLLTELQNQYASNNPGSDSNPFTSASLSSSAPVAAEQSTGDEPSSSKKDVDSKVIAGAVVGGVFGLLLLVGLSVFIVRSKREVRAAPKKSNDRKGDAYRNPTYDPSGSGERSSSVYEAATMVSHGYKLGGQASKPIEA